LLGAIPDVQESARQHANVRCTREGAAEARFARNLFDALQVSFGVREPHAFSRVMFPLIRSLVAAGFLALCGAPSNVVAQSPTPNSPYPANDSRLTLPSGTVVRQRNLVVFRGQNEASLTIVIQTPTDSTASDRVSREAQEVAALHDAYARSRGISRISVAICRSQACLELREVANEMFHFVRTADGLWVDRKLQAP
jgi:hypothetical protein